MPYWVRESDRRYTPPPEGLHPACCCDVIDLGMVESAFGAKPTAEIRWQLELLNPDTNKRFVVRRRFTASLAPKANLRKALETWRGRRFTENELQGFDLEKLLGVPCQVQVMHHVTDDGRTYANVEAVIPFTGPGPKPVVVDHEREGDRVARQAAGGGPTEPASAAGQDMPF